MYAYYFLWVWEGGSFRPSGDRICCQSSCAIVADVEPALSTTKVHNYFLFNAGHGPLRVHGMDTVLACSALIEIRFLSALYNLYYFSHSYPTYYNAITCLRFSRVRTRVCSSRVTPSPPSNNGVATRVSESRI